MAKKYRIRDRLLLAMAIFGDMADEVIGGGRRAYRYGKLFTYSPPGYKKNPFSTAVNRMLAAGDLQKSINHGQPYFQITGIGKRKLTRRFPLLKWQNQPWDSLWRMVVFDIQEADKSKRDLFRRKLLELGFGQLQQSVYISPHDIAEDLYQFIQLHGLQKQAYVLVNKQLFIDDFQELVKQVWKLTDINEQYYQVYKILKGNMTNSNKKLRQSTTLYLDVISQDPFLPKQLLPKPWYGLKLQKLWQNQSQ
jgi:DNA-binding transcriptional regulator PaaX